MTMRLGMLIAGTRSAPEALWLARGAEQAGVSEVWISEDYFQNGAFSLAGAVASVTSRAQIGLGVINPWTRHPMLTAMEFATLAELAPQRAILGIGASNRTWMTEQCGIDFDHPVAVLGEATDIIRAALQGGHVQFAGRHFTVDAALERGTAATARIYYGVKGRRMLELAGSKADGVVLSIMSSPGYVRWVRDQVGPDIDISAYVLAACGANARLDIRPAVATYLGFHGAHDITLHGGLNSCSADAFRQASLDGTAIDVSEEVLDSFAIAGDVDDCVAGLERFAAAGLNSAILKDPGDDRVDDLLALVATFRQRHPLIPTERMPQR